MVTFSHKRNKKLQHVNLQYKKVFWPEGQRWVKLRISTKVRWQGAAPGDRQGVQQGWLPATAGAKKCGGFKGGAASRAQESSAGALGLQVRLT